jgi:CheY-like chemotaxis protein
MIFNALVAEPCDAAWAAIADGIRRHFPDASLLRVKDGEQALRFLLHRGLLTDDPESPSLVVLAAELPVISVERVFVRLRQDSRTRATPVIIRWHDLDKTKVDLPDLLLAEGGLLLVCGPVGLEAQVAEAVRQLCGQPTSYEAVAS